MTSKIIAWLCGILMGCGLAIQSFAAPQVKRVLTVAVGYQNAKQPLSSAATLQNIFYGSKGIRDYYLESSRGDLVLEVNVIPPITLAMDRLTGKCSWPRSQVEAALRAAGHNLESYDILAIVMMPPTTGCNGGGAFSGTPNIALSWSFNGMILAHEMGHNLGLGHANSIACLDPTTNKRSTMLIGRCDVTAYGNRMDLMAAQSFGSLSSTFRQMLGWSEPIIHSGGTASYTIGTIHGDGQLPTAVRIPLPNSTDPRVRTVSQRQLWIEYRQPIGFDAQKYSIMPRNYEGALVNITGQWQVSIPGTTRFYNVFCSAQHPCLLDMTPETLNHGDAALAVGKSWTDPLSGVTITVVERTPESLTITVVSP